MADWQAQDLSRLIQKHAAFPLKVARGQRLTNNAATSSYVTSLAGFSHGLRNGSISARDYVFNRIDNTSIAVDMPDLGGLFAKVACRLVKSYCALAPTGWSSHQQLSVYLSISISITIIIYLSIYLYIHTHIHTIRHIGVGVRRH